MHTFFSFVLLCLMAGSAFAQSSLPACQGDLSRSRWTNCFGTFTHPSGNKFVVDFKDGKPIGQMTATFPSGNKYVGEQKEGKPNGQGTYTFADGNKYVGEHKDGKRDGQGTFTFANGMKQVGVFKDDKPNGQGIQYRADGTIVSSGQWADGRLVQSFWIDTSRFPFYAPIQTAQSSRAEVDRVAVEAQAARPQATSPNAAIPSNLSNLPPCGSVIKHNCFGTYASPEANYAGDFKSGMPNGQGTYIFNDDGRKYIGEWEEGRIKGEGVFTIAKSIFGVGSLTLANGEKHVGQFVRGAPHGEGIEYSSDGLIIRQGLWETGRLLEFYSLDIQRFPFNPLPETIFRLGYYPSKLPPCALSSVIKGSTSQRGGIIKHNCYGVHTFPDGKKYFGEFQNGSPNGQGTFISSDIKYVGEWKDGNMDGEGVLILRRDSKVVGQFKGDNINGLAIEYTLGGAITKQGRWENGILIEEFAVDRQRFPYHSSPVVAGTVVGMNNYQSKQPPCPSDSTLLYAWDKPNDPGIRPSKGSPVYVENKKNAFRADGQGSYTYPQGKLNAGEFTKGKSNGMGAFTFTNGDKYVGEYKNYKRNGKGTYTFADGSKYVGDFKDDMFEGKGTYTFDNGNIYVGGFYNNDRSGEGIEYRADGSIINTGMWAGKLVESFAINAKRFPFIAPTKTAQSSKLRHNCFGIHFGSNSKYVGEYQNGLPHGQGAEYNGLDFYVGQFKNGFKDGQGMQIHAASKYIGEFKNGLLNGLGTKIDPYGNKYEGMFKDSREKGSGILTYSSYFPRDVAKYVGEFDGGPTGQGIEYSPSGSIVRQNGILLKQR